MTAAIAAGRRLFPRGYADFGYQLLIWFGFLAAYQVARGVADRDPSRAFANGWRVIDVEQRFAGLGELTLQGWTQSSRLLETLVSWTYWNSEFTVIGLALLWVYLRRNSAFTRFRNTILLANVLGLVGYVLLPTAPPRFFTSMGFTNTLGQFGGLNHGSGLVELAANPYAAMPSLHAADALIVGVVLASVVRHWPWKVVWLLWPFWVWFAVMATANHFWLDVLAGIVLGTIALALVYQARIRSFIARETAHSRNAMRESAVLHRVKQGYTTGAGSLASRSIVGLTRTRVTPNALTTAGVSLCVAAAVLVYFEYRNDLLFFWLGAIVFVIGSILDILDGALARAGGKTTPFGSFLDSTTDRVGEGAMLGAIALIFSRHGNEVALGATVAAVAGSFLVSYTRAKAEGLGLRGDVGFGSRAERVVVITAGLVLAPWGALQWAIYLLTATAWITVLQRILFVRKQLSGRS